ncbi:MAG: nitroreductase family protein [Nitrosopumilus sp.]|nr:nitroreductase family protein [Nitrosopumilus sp.]MDH3384424.1 nitroreductase family protein [Nitrosopumilus sp.]
MNTFDAIINRRAIKKFDPNHKMTTDEIKFLMELAILSPSSYNQQNWRFITISEQKIKEEISKAARNQAQPSDGSLVIILCGNTSAWMDNPKRYWKNYPKEKQEYVANALKRKYSDNSQNKRDEAMRSCGFAAQTIMLAAKQMGLDSCPMSGFEYDELAKIIHLPNDHLIVMMIVVGKALEPPGQRGGQLPIEEIVFENRFS